jgi:pimeloyl-ACP methyl ester carboxylesterase
MSSVAVNGITVGYDDTGPRDAASVLVLVHGHPFDRSMWRPQTEFLAATGWRVIAPDLRGYGASTVVPGVTPLSANACDIAALCDRLGVRRFVLGGLSMGGQIVMECHRLFPERLRGLLLADTTERAETPEGRRRRAATADRLLREGMSAYAADELPRMVSPATISARPAVAAHVSRMMRETAPAGAAAALRGRAERPDYAGSLARATAPVLVVVGADDAYTPVADARLLAGRVPHSTIAVIDGAGHMPNLERPDAFNGALMTFLDTIPEES